jgi:hypothetical protein
MSEIASEIAQSNEAITTSEFLGMTFAERREAVTQVENFLSEARLALADSVAVKVGQQVLMKFRPSMVVMREYDASFPVYSIMDTERAPLEKIVTIQEVNAENLRAVVTEGEHYEGKYDQKYFVNIGSIINIADIETQQ